MAQTTTQGINKFNQNRSTDEYAYKETNIFAQDNPYLQVIRLSIPAQSSIDVEAKRIVKHLLCEKWSLPTPNLILSILGDNIFNDTTKFSIRNNFIQDFKLILMKTNVWIFTDGKNSGITKEICQAIREIRFSTDLMTSSRISCIGIINKTPEFDKTDLGQKEVTQTSLTIENGSSFQRNSLIENPNEIMKFEYNHSHCLWFKKQMNDEKLQRIRTAIEYYSSEENFNCPILQILADGNEYYLNTIFASIHRGWPVLIIESQNALNNITEKYRQLYGRKETTRDYGSFNKCQRDFKNDIDRTNPLYQMTSSEAYFLLNFYSFKSSLYESVLRTLFNWAKYETDRQKRYFKQLQIAITWNYTQILLPKNSVVEKLNKEYLHKILIDAIWKNRVDFVEYLIEHGALIQYIDLDKEIDKYWQIREPNMLPLKTETIANMSMKTKECFYKDYTLIELKSKVMDKPFELEIFRDWLLWSVFMDRPDMAKCLCSYTQNPVVAALLINKIYRKAAKRAVGENKKEEYRKNEKEFDIYASKIIDECFDLDDKFGIEILLYPSKIYFNQAPLILAESNKTRTFLGTKTMNKHLDDMWYGDINEKSHSKLFIGFLMFVSCLLVFLIPLKPVNKILSSREDSESTSNENWFRKIGNRYKNFYRGRIAVRFFYNIFIYILFLGLFSYVLLVDYYPLNTNGGTRNGYTNILIPVNEIFVHIFSWCFIIEEIEELRQYIRDKLRTGSDNIFWGYFTENKWNILDFLTYLTYLVGFITRFFVIEDLFVTSKIFLSINLFLWYVRILHLFFASEKLGPKLLMIFNIMLDLVFFICFILIFLLAYSITSYALLTTSSIVSWIPTSDGSSSRTYSIVKGDYNRSSLWSWNVLRNSLEWGLWKIYGQVDIIDHQQADNTTITAGTDAYGNIAFILTIIYVCIANVLLLNVLVALFNATINNVQDEALQLWAYHRFVLITEYGRKSMLPPPFSLIPYLISLFKYCKRNKNLKDDDSTYPYSVTHHLLWRTPLARSELRHMYNMERESYIARSCWKLERDKTDRIQSSYDNQNVSPSFRLDNDLQNQSESDSEDTQVFTPYERSNIPSSSHLEHRNDRQQLLENISSTDDNGMV